jgi:hypothetical protein
MPDTASESLAKLQHNILLRLVVYYAVLAVVVLVSMQLMPARLETVLHEAVQPLLGYDTSTSGGLSEAVRRGPELSPALALLMSFVAAMAALLLSLPLSWVYMFTRQKKGYSQSVVHTLVLLPIVVAMVAALVRSSVALAFSLAGIVAAVRFRTTLEDSKDAVFVFAVMALGLSCGVQLEIATVLSVLFIVVTLVLWYTDFARTPPALEGQRAEQHLQRAVAIANRTSQFVARLDREILDAMAPAQLDALQGRLEKRRTELESKKKKKKGDDTADDDEGGPHFDGRLTITVSDPEAGQAAVEQLLASMLKRWKLVRQERGDAEAVIVYAVRPRKGTTLETVADAVERAGAPFVARVEAERWI